MGPSMIEGLCQRKSAARPWRCAPHFRWAEPLNAFVFVLTRPVLAEGPIASHERSLVSMALDKPFFFATRACLALNTTGMAKQQDLITTMARKAVRAWHNPPRP